MVRWREGVLVAMAAMSVWYVFLLAPDRRAAVDHRIYEVARETEGAAATGLMNLRQIANRSRRS